MARCKQYIGSYLDGLLEETGELAEVNTVAIKRVIAWEIAQKMETSRSALDRLLDPANTSVTLHTLDNAARAVGKTLRIELS